MKTTRKEVKQGMKAKRYEMKAKQRGKLKTRGYIEMKDSGSGAELYLYGDIVDDELTAAYFGGSCPQEIADFMNSLTPNEPLTIYFNSPGGDVFAGLAIYNILTRHAGKKTGQVDGMAASIASVILMGCDDRIVNTGAQIMVHNPWTYCCGNAEYLRDTADQLDQATESILDVYMTAAADGVERDQIKNLMDAETWMRGETAAKYFTLSMKDGATAAAADSDLFGDYKNLPAALKAQANKKAKDDQRAKDLLADLYLYGTAK